MDLKINMYFGLAQTFKYYYIFNLLIKKNLVNKIYASLSYKLLQHYRNVADRKMYDNYLVIWNHINEHKEKLIIENDEKDEYSTLTPQDLGNQYNLLVKYTIFNHIIPNTNNFNFNYVTISAKVMNVDKSIFNKIKYELFNRLNKFKIKVLILGERTVAPCTEYEIHKTFSMYDELIHNLNNYEDMTIDNNESNNELEPLLKSIEILNKSKLNIFISNGGVADILPYVSDKILGLCLPTKNDLFNPNCFESNTKNIKIFFDHNKFINNLYLNNQCVLLFHQGWTDIINSLGLITYYCKKYTKVVLLIRDDSKQLIDFYLRSCNNLDVMYMEKSVLDNQMMIKFILDNLITSEIKFSGIGCHDVYRDDKYSGVFSKNNSMFFVESFYESYDIPYKFRIDMFEIHRNIELENKIYNEFISKHGDDYVLYHEVKDNYLGILKTINLNQISGIYFDYIKVLKNAKEIHLLDSSWAAIIYLLDAKYKLFCHIKIVVYAKRNYQEMFIKPVKLDNWTIIKY